MKRKVFLFVIVIILNSSFLIHNCPCQWFTYNLPYNGIAYSLEFYNLNTGISCGHTIGSFQGYIYFTTNSGTNWTLASYPLETRALSGIQFINASTIYTCGAENILKNGEIKQGNDFASFPESIREKLLKMGIREFEAEYKALFLKSTNAGVNWQKVGQFDTTKGYILDIHFFDANTGYALIDSGSYGKTKFYKTTNSGQNWQLIKYIETDAIVSEMIFFNLNTGIAAGFNYGGRIYKTTNGGLNWSIKTMPTQIDGITFFNSNTGIAIGISEAAGRCNIYKTVNAGGNWDSLTSVQGGRFIENLKSLPSTGTALAVGSTITPSKITTLKTINYGTTWIVKEFLPEKLMTGIALIDQNNFFISGGDVNTNAVILKSTNGGNVFVNQTGNEIPEEFELEQNYPNPFNQSTMFNFQCSMAGIVQVKVFDINGREVATLVNEGLEAGTYEVRFDATDLPSGIYFYQLKANNFIETKKLVLLK